MKYTNKVQLTYWLWKKGWSLLELQRQTKINYKTLLKIKHTGKATFDSMEKLAEVFKITIPQLFIIPDDNKYEIGQI